MSADETRPDASARCDDATQCPLHDALATPVAVERREFLRVAAMAFASIGLLGAVAERAEPMPVRALKALAGGSGPAEEKRYPMPTADGVMIDKENSVIVARAAGKVYAFSLACPHQNTALRWQADDHQFQCPKHKSRYTEDGVFIEGRATRNMDRLAVKRDGEVLVVDIDALYQQDENPKEWSAAFVPA
jgi:nitrite reductase/ring-hydroxylating ferredoxin subunit